jgi:hypothetical protein
VIHVFGITHAGTAIPEALDGLGDPPSPVRTVEHGGLAAVVCDLEQPPRTRADLDRHQQVQSELVQSMTLVPLRFGTLMEDERELVEGLLTAHAAELRDLIASVEGRVQLTVKAIYHEDVPLREAVKAHPDLKSTSDRLRERNAGRDAWVQLGERVAGAIEAHRAADESAIVARLEPHAERVLVEEPGHERMVARLQLLVPRDARAPLDKAVAELTAEQEERMSISYVGPLAPYSFCDVSMDAEAAWG